MPYCLRKIISLTASYPYKCKAYKVKHNKNMFLKKAELDRHTSETTSIIKKMDKKRLINEVNLSEFVNYDTDIWTNYVHIIPEINERRLTLYRSVIKDKYENDCIKTVIDNVTIGFDEKGKVNPHYFHLSGGEANTALTFLDSLKWARNVDHIKFTHYEDNGKIITKNNDITEESLYLKWKNSSGRESEICINKVWEVDTQKMAKYS